jgi:GlpG protein
MEALSAQDPDPQQNPAVEPAKRRGRWPSPPSLQAWHRYPVTSGVALAAIFVTLGWWSGSDIEALQMGWRAWDGEPWRLVTSALPHLDILHLVFNLFWLWVFGTFVERVLGHLAAAGLMLFFAAGASAAEYAFFSGGVGLSGVGYGLFGLLWVLSRKDPRFAWAVTDQVVLLFLSWFILCCVLTAADVWRVGNAAHAAGAVLGVLVGLTLSARGSRRLAWGGLLVGTMALLFLWATVERPYVNLAGQVGPEEAHRGYLDLEQGCNESAARRYELAVKLNPTQGDWWYNLGVARQRLERSDEAIAAYQRAVELKPGDKGFRQTLAGLKAQLAQRKQTAGETEEAIRLYREALLDDPHQAASWYDLGVACEKLGRIEGARAAYQRAVELEPEQEIYRVALESLPPPAGQR